MERIRAAGNNGATSSGAIRAFSRALQGIPPGSTVTALRGQRHLQKRHGGPGLPCGSASQPPALPGRGRYRVVVSKRERRPSEPPGQLHTHIHTHIHEASAAPPPRNTPRKRLQSSVC
ncbi:hypothetical protein VOLCADRAFT_104240, partial [Volvox carteri f. nagariensis]